MTSIYRLSPQAIEMSVMYKTCILCGTQFWYAPGMNHPGKYCSHNCRDEAATTVPDASCVMCGNSVHPPKGEGRRHRGKRFCSRVCYYESLKGKPSPIKSQVTLTCVVCDNEFQVKRYRLKDNARYCSRGCYLVAHSENNTTPELVLLRGSAAYREWRTSVFERDHYRCVLCADHNFEGRGETVVLHADHIKPFAHHPELRFDVDNGRTLCVPCHRSTPTYGGRSRRKVAVAVDAAGY